MTEGEQDRRLGKIEVQLIDQEIRLGKIELQLSQLAVDMKNVIRILIGNGKDGLEEKVLLNTERVSIMQKADEKRAEFWQKVLLAVIGMVITNIGVIVMLILGLR